MDAKNDSVKSNIDPGKRLTEQIQLFLLKSVLVVANALLLLCQRLYFRPAKQPRRILLFRTGSFGDSICALPAIASIRRHYSQARIDLLTNTGHAGKNLVSLGQLLPAGTVRTVINYQGASKRELIRQLRREKYDLIIQLPQYTTTWPRLMRDMAVFRFMCGIPSGFGWQLDHLHFFLKSQERAGNAPNERARLLAILKKNGIAPLPETAITLPLSETDRLAVQHIVRERFSSDNPLIGIVPGAKRPQNRWPATCFSQVIRHFSPTYNIALIGGPDDQSLAESLEQPGRVIAFCGAFTPMQLVWLMRECRLVLSNDTGPMHLAYTAGVPLVALFSARDLPGRWYPPASERTVVFRSFEIACSVCFSETCADNVCMKKIRPPDVIAAMERLLGQPEHSR